MKKIGLHKNCSSKIVGLKIVEHGKITATFITGGESRVVANRFKPGLEY